MPSQGWIYMEGHTDPCGFPLNLFEKPLDPG